MPAAALGAEPVSPEQESMRESLLRMSQQWMK
jgi:hypothetical protein